MLVCAPWALLAQFGNFTFGAKGGVPLLEAPRTNVLSNNESKPYTVGPFIEYRFLDRVGIEFSPLYRRNGSSNTQPFQIGLPAPSLYYSVLRQRSNTWEFPLIGKYYFGNKSSSFRPWLGTGWSFQKSWNTLEGELVEVKEDLSRTSKPFSSSFSSNTNVGAAFTMGATWQKGRIGIAPELRYTRWGTGSLRQDQLDILVGIRF